MQTSGELTSASTPIGTCDASPRSSSPRASYVWLSRWRFAASRRGRLERRSLRGRTSRAPSAALLRPRAHPRPLRRGRGAARLSRTLKGGRRRYLRRPPRRRRPAHHHYRRALGGGLRPAPRRRRRPRDERRGLLRLGRARRRRRPRQRPRRVAGARRATSTRRGAAPGRLRGASNRRHDRALAEVRGQHEKHARAARRRSRPPARRRRHLLRGARGLLTRPVVIATWKYRPSDPTDRRTTPCEALVQ